MQLNADVLAEPNADDHVLKLIPSLIIAVEYWLQIVQIPASYLTVESNGTIVDLIIT